MDTALSSLQGHFRIKSDGELLALSSSAQDMSHEARLALLAELQHRLTSMGDRPDIQLIHGWYTVFVQRQDIQYPDKCPNCLRQELDTVVAFRSLPDTNIRAFVTHQRINVSVPFCRECADKWKMRNRVVGWPTYCVVIAWIAVCLKFGLGRYAVYLGTFVLSLPMVALLRGGAAVMLGNYEKDWLEFRFRSADYAVAFASANHVAAQNTETIRDEFAAAIDSVRQLGSAEPS